jgi:hypothetical protein
VFPPRLLATRPEAHQYLLATVPALILGTIAGLALDLSGAVYGLLLIVATLGGVGAGLEHATPAEGAQRGLVGGLLFGAGVLLGHHLLNERAKASLPHPEAVEVIVTAIAGMPLGAIGAALRRRHDRRAGGLDVAAPSS